MYQVELRDRADRESGWFDSEITGTHDHCYSQGRTQPDACCNIQTDARTGRTKAASRPLTLPLPHPPNGG